MAIRIKSRYVTSDDKEFCDKEMAEDWEETLELAAEMNASQLSNFKDIAQWLREHYTLEPKPARKAPAPAVEEE